MAEDADIEIIVKEVSESIRNVQDKLPGFHTLLLLLLEELEVEKLEDVVKVAILNPKKFYSAFIKLLKSPLVADGYIYLLLTTIFKKYRTSFTVSDAVKALRKGDLNEWRKILKELFVKIAGER